jgi:UPF0755 protein
MQLKQKPANKISKLLYRVITEPVVFSVLIVCIVLISFRFTILSTPVRINYNSQKFTIPRGTNLSRIASLLDEKKIIPAKNTFILAAHLMSRNKSLKAGVFDLEQAKDYRSLLNILSNPQAHSIRITIPEGYQTKQIAALLANRLNFTAEEFMQHLNDKRLLKRLGIQSPSLEGYLFPDTYDFIDTDDPPMLIRRMVNHFFQILDDSLLNEITASKRSLHEILTLASIVEGECVVDEERPVVASVYLNRLRRRMRLESDPTIQYILPDGPRRLLNSDIEIDSPYNTYRRRGLPPGPINNPGLKSILAAIRPAETNYLYMVAVGDGTHSFTSDYDEFLKAKRHFQKVRRKIALEAMRRNSN